MEKNFGSGLLLAISYNLLWRNDVDDNCLNTDNPDIEHLPAIPFI
jgi:hypothetical protein